MLSAPVRRELRRTHNLGVLPTPVARPGARFYVTIRSGRRSGALLGPYASHMSALANVKRGRELVRAALSAGQVNTRDVMDAEFAEFGTASVMRTVRARFGR